jgi:hypothetical protein
MADGKVLELFKDEGFLEELVKTESAEDVQKLFAAKGADVSTADVSAEELSAFIAETRRELDKELSDEELALVAGGYSYGDEVDEYLLERAAEYRRQAAKVLEEIEERDAKNPLRKDQVDLLRIKAAVLMGFNSICTGFADPQW